MECRDHCGACCIAPSISSPIPGMPSGKPANTLCVQLTSDFRCKIFGHPERPLVCSELMPSADMCGDNREQALNHIQILEAQTS